MGTSKDCFHSQVQLSTGENANSLFISAFFALLTFIEGLECFTGNFKDENASKDPPKKTETCPTTREDGEYKCLKEIYEDKTADRGCEVRDKDGCITAPEKRWTPSDGVERVLPAHTKCYCSKDKCNAACCILPSYMLWISAFAATTWCRYAFDSL